MRDRHRDIRSKSSPACDTIRHHPATFRCHDSAVSSLRRRDAMHVKPGHSATDCGDRRDRSTAPHLHRAVPAQTAAAAWPNRPEFSKPRPHAAFRGMRRSRCAHCAQSHRGLHVLPHRATL